MKAPKVEKKAPVILTLAEVNALLEQPGGNSPKEKRDKAMLELLYATGIRVSELIGLQMEDLNLKVGYIVCRDRNKERMVPFGKHVKEALTGLSGECQRRAAERGGISLAFYQLQRQTHEPSGLLEAN